MRTLSIILSILVLGSVALSQSNQRVKYRYVGADTLQSNTPSSVLTVDDTLAISGYARINNVEAKSGDMVAIRDTARTSLTMGIGSLTGTIDSALTVFSGADYGGIHARGGLLTGILQSNLSGDVRNIILNQLSGSMKRTQIAFSRQGTEQFLVGVDASGNNTRDFFIADQQRLSVPFIIDSTGKVGINIAAPTVTLDVAPKVRIGGSFVSPFNTTVFVAADEIDNPTNETEGIYVIHRVGGDLDANVHDGLAAELVINTGTNGGFNNAIEATVLIDSGGTTTLSDIRSLTANMIVDDGTSGSVTSASLLRAQTIAALPVGFSMADVYGLYLEGQSVGSRHNYPLYVASDTAFFGGTIRANTTLSMGGNINTNGFFLTNDGGNEGVSISTAGNATITGTSTILSVLNQASAVGTLTRTFYNAWNASSAAANYAEIRSEVQRNTASGQSGKLTLRTARNGTLITAVDIDSSQNVVLAGSLSIGGGSALSKTITASRSYDCGSIAAGVDSVFTITATGAVAGNPVSVGVSVAAEAGLIITAECATNDVVNVRISNHFLVSAVDPATRTFKVLVVNF